MVNDPKPLLSATLQPINERTARLTIVEGRYHQVRRMFAAVGNHVQALHRERMGLLSVEGVREGEWRLLGEADLRAVTG